MAISIDGPDLSFLADPPETAAEAAALWSQAMGDYMKDLFQMSVQSGKDQVELAQAILQTDLTLSFQTSLSADMAFDQPIRAFNRLVVASMSTTYGGIWSGTAPVESFSDAVLTELLFSDAESAIETIAKNVYSWTITGTATNVNTGVIVPWS